MADALERCIDAMDIRDQQWVRDGALYGSDYFAALLGAIPDDVLARYAIERGVIVQVDVWDRAPSDPDRVRVYYEDETVPADAVPLYRLATEDETL